MGKKYKHKSKWAIPKEGYAGALWRMLPALVMVGIVPLIIRVTSFETNLTQYGWFDTTEIGHDFFLASKSVVLMLLLFVMAGCIAVRLWREKKKIPFVKLLIPLFVYGALAFLSACFSINRGFSFWGSQDQFETIWALLSYVAVVYYVFLYAKEELELRVLTDAICFGATIIGLLGTLQGIGFDFLANKFFQKLITTEKFWRLIDGELSLTFTDGQAVATLYNPNYLGVYGSFVLPFLTMLIIFEKSKWRRIWHIVDFILVAVALLSSRSRAGFIAAGVALAVALVICFRGLIKYWYLTIPAVSFMVVIVLLVNAYNDNLIFDRLNNIFSPDQVVVEEYIAEDGTVVRKTGLTELYTTEESDTTKGNVTFTYNEVTAHIYVAVEQGTFGIYVLDENGDQIELVETEAGGDTFYFKHPALEEIQVQPGQIGEYPGFALKAEGQWNFVYNANEEYRYVIGYEGSGAEPVLKESDMIMAEAYGFENRQNMFSSRGYIWSRTIPLLKKYIFLGSGPDTFILEYPQNDFLMMNKHGFSYSFMSKPHSWYLQVGVQTGVLSLICLLVFYVWYTVWCLRLYAFRKLNTLQEGFGIAAYVGSIGYMISGISNDSMVVTAPAFWGMIALGITANAMVVKFRKEKAAVAE